MGLIFKTIKGDVELPSNVPILTTQNFIDSKESLKYYTGYSQSFTIKKNANIERIFNYYDVLEVQAPNNTKIEGDVVLDNVLLGHYVLQLVEVEKYDYKVRLISPLAKILDKLKGLKLRDVLPRFTIPYIFALFEAQAENESEQEIYDDLLERKEYGGLEIIRAFERNNLPLNALRWFPANRGIPTLKNFKADTFIDIENGYNRYTINRKVSCAETRQYPPVMLNWGFSLPYIFYLIKFKIEEILNVKLKYPTNDDFLENCFFVLPNSKEEDIHYSYTFNLGNVVNRIDYDLLDFLLDWCKLRNYRLGHEKGEFILAPFSIGDTIIINREYTHFNQGFNNGFLKSSTTSQHVDLSLLSVTPHNVKRGELGLKEIKTDASQAFNVVNGRKISSKILDGEGESKKILGQVKFATGGANWMQTPFASVVTEKGNALARLPSFWAYQNKGVKQVTVTGEESFISKEVDIYYAENAKGYYPLPLLSANLNDKDVELKDSLAIYCGNKEVPKSTWLYTPYKAENLPIYILFIETLPTYNCYYAIDDSLTDVLKLHKRFNKIPLFSTIGGISKNLSLSFDTGKLAFPYIATDIEEDLFKNWADYEIVRTSEKSIEVEVFINGLKIKPEEIASKKYFYRGSFWKLEKLSDFPTFGKGKTKMKFIKI